MGDMTTTAWPEAGRVLIAELAAAPGRLCLIVGDPKEAEELLGLLGADLGLVGASVGSLVAAFEEPPDADECEELLNRYDLLVDLDVLMWPDLGTNPAALLRRLARRRPRIAFWPGDIRGQAAIYSEPGRPDHHDFALTDAVVLHPRKRAFPDELPYTVERIAP